LYIFQPVSSESDEIQDENIPMEYRTHINNSFTKEINISEIKESPGAHAKPLNTTKKIPPRSILSNLMGNYNKWLSLSNYDYEKYNNGSFKVYWGGVEREITYEEYKFIHIINEIEKLPFNEKVIFFGEILTNIIEGNTLDDDMKKIEDFFLRYYTKQNHNNKNNEYCVYYFDSTEKQNINFMIDVDELQLPEDKPIFFRLMTEDGIYKNYMYNFKEHKFEDKTFILNLPISTVTQNNQNNYIVGHIEIKHPETLSGLQRLYAGTGATHPSIYLKLKFDKLQTLHKDRRNNIKFGVCGQSANAIKNKEVVDFINTLVGEIKTNSGITRYTDLSCKSKNVIGKKKKGSGKNMQDPTNGTEENSLCVEIEYLLRLRNYYRTDEEIKMNKYYFLQTVETK
jgi:hypothetical protein